MEREQRIAAVVAEQAIEAYLAEGDPYRVRHRLQVTSFGGSGTTALTIALLDAGLDLPRGPAQWPHKHLRRAPSTSEVPDGFRVLYPVGDPRDAVLSLFRRGIQGGHWRAMQRVDHAEPVLDPPASLADLATYLAGGVDEFDMAGHLHGWMHHPPGYEVMVLRFDLIEQAWADVVAFAGLPPDTPPIELQRRRSDWRSEPPAVRDALDAMYGALAAEIETLPPTRIF